MSSFNILMRNLSITGLLLRLLSLYGGYRTWMFANMAWHDGHAGSTPHDIALYTRLGHGDLISLWETASVTAALWAAAWAFDRYKAGAQVSRKIFLASGLVGMGLLAAELPAAFMSRTVTYPGPFYVDYNSLAIAAIASCVILAAIQGRRLRAELEQFV